MADQELKVYAKQIVLDPVKGNPQRRDILDEEWEQGIQRLGGISCQIFNTLMNLITHHSPPSDICPYPFPSSVTIPDVALVMNGQTITETESPYLYAAYGATLPDMTSENLTGFVWCVRNH